MGHLNAQALDHVQGEVLVKLKPEVSPRAWAQSFTTFDGRNSDFQYNGLVSKPMNVWSYQFDFDAVHEDRLLEAIRRHPQVELAQFNHFIELRNEPNDPQFVDQWQYINTGQSGGTPGADIDIELAWDITTGGVTPTGDTIVVCVIDNGIDLDHEDFDDNLWVNHKEIPNNNIDDDNNGYVDDYLGWNTGTDNDNVGFASHGTAVSGIVGAQGNNGVGVAGINWDVKVMFVDGGTGVESEVLEAYSFPLIHRQRYNATNGEEGYFVVSTNASWGVDFGQPANAPLWCAFYDTLGVHGILSFGATINGNQNVDEVGDLPTGCSSDYLVTVTNMNHNDVKVTGAGYGAETIDLGAFGAGTWTVTTNDNYSGFGGTSGATPHVAGTAALLYSAPCPGLMALSQADPGAAALMVRDMIFAGVDPNESLDGITVTGGRLNVNNSLQLLMLQCGDCIPASSLTASEVIDTSANITWNINDSINRIDLRYRIIGDTVWTVEEDVLSPYSLDGLFGCTDYEVELKAFCNLDTLDFLTHLEFKTDGCCELPGELTIGDVTSSSAAVSWPSVLAAESYNIQIKPADPDSMDWVVVNTSDTSYEFTDLNLCTIYEIQIQTVCRDSTMTEFSESFQLLTSDCGPCLDLDYCEPQNFDASEEWITFVKVGPLSNTSGSNGGYGNFTLLPADEFELGETLNITLVPGFSGGSFQEYFQVWLDYDQNGSFEEDELLFDPGESTSGLLMGQATVPGNIPLGNTRLRVVMQFQNPGVVCNFLESFGEVEDYCVKIVPPAECAIASNLDTLGTDLTEVQLRWDPVPSADRYRFRYRNVANTDTSWTELIVLNNFLNLPGLEECQEYESQVKTECVVGESDYSSSFFFPTACSTGIRDLPPGVQSLNAFPNPFSEQIQVRLELESRKEEMDLTLLDSYGRTLNRLAIPDLSAGTYQYQFASNDLPPGVYLLRLTDIEGNTIVKKLVKM